MRPGRIYNIYRIITDRLPSTYPRAVIAIYNDIEELREYFKKYYDDYKPPKDKDYPPVAFCDETYVIHIPISIKEEDDNDKWNDANLAQCILHELGHLYALSKYGKHDRRWRGHDRAERYADEFAWRWLRILKKEGLIK